METNKIYFERAIFLSWYCNLGDCTFCYMSTQSELIKDPEKAKRSQESILAEALICKLLGWKIGFLSAGYGSYTEESISDLCKKIYSIYGKKVWLNIGVIPEKTIKRLLPYIEGVCGAVETTNQQLHKQVAPNKPIEPIEYMYKICEKYNLKKAMTFIVGLGEDIQDFNSLRIFISRNKIDKITFYALNPIKKTIFEKSSSPNIQYYIQWIDKTRKNFPDIDIVAGTWVKNVSYINLMVEAGANSLTKFPAIKLFNSKYAKIIEDEIVKSGKKLEGSFTKIPYIDIEKELDNLDGEIFDINLKNRIKLKFESYLKSMTFSPTKDREIIVPHKSN